MIACSYVSVDMDGNERLPYAAFSGKPFPRVTGKGDHVRFTKKKGKEKWRNKKWPKGRERVGEEGIAIGWVVVVYRYFVPRE